MSVTRSYRGRPDRTARECAVRHPRGGDDDRGDRKGQPLLQGRYIDPSECDEQRRESLMQITIRIHLACRYEDLIAHQHTDVSGKRLESASAQ